MATWVTYARIGKDVWILLHQRFPELGKVPLSDIHAVVEEVLTTTLTIDDALIHREPPPQGLTATPQPRPHYRLVLKPGPRAYGQ